MTEFPNMEKQDLLMAETWCSNVSLLSKVTPRVLVVSDLNGGASNVNRSVWRKCTATLMSAQPDTLWLIQVQGKTINTEPLMQCQKTSLEATSYWPEEVGEMKGCVSSEYCWWWIPDELMIWLTWEVRTEKKDWAQHRTLRYTSAQRGVSPFWLNKWRKNFWLVFTHTINHIFHCYQRMIHILCHWIDSAIINNESLLPCFLSNQQHWGRPWWFTFLDDPHFKHFCSLSSNFCFWCRGRSIKFLS